MDTSWVTRKRSPEHIAKALLNEGFDVILVLDPDHRHHAKVASIERRGKREGARSKCYELRIELSSNERYVRAKKTSGAIKRGAKASPGGNAYAWIADLWLAYGFQTNFMFQSVH